MAWSGSITGSWNGSNAQYLKLRCDWEVTSQDTTNKTSTVTLKWIAQKTNASMITNKTGAAWSRNVGGATPPSASGSVNFNIGSTAIDTDYTFLTQTGIVIQHAANGVMSASLSGTINLSGTSAGIGSFSGSMDLPTIATTAPTVSSLTISDVGIVKNNQTAYQIVGAYVAGFTKFKLEAAASAASPATIARYDFYNDTTLLGSVNTSSGSASFTYGSANAAGTYKFKVVVTDSYGNTKTYPSTVPDTVVKPYSPPANQSWANRCNSSGTADPSGAYANLHARWTITTFNSSPDNSATCTVTFMGDTHARNNMTQEVVQGVQTSQSYVATFVVTDALGVSTTVSSTVPSELVNFSLYPSNVGGAAFGEIAQSNTFAVNHNAIFRGTMDVPAWKRAFDLASNKTATITFAGDLAGLLYAAGPVQAGFGYLAFVSGYTTGSRVSAQVVKSSTYITTTFSDSSNPVFKIKNTSSNTINVGMFILNGSITNVSIS